MAKGDGRGGNHGGSKNGNCPAHDVGPADIELGRLILLAREGNRQAVRERLAKVSRAEIVLARAAQCVKAGALQSAIGVLERSFAEIFGDGADPDVRRPQRESSRGNYPKGSQLNTPIAELGLPVRIVNALEKGFEAIYVAELCKYSAAELDSSQRGRGSSIGPVGLRQIRQALAEIGCVLRGEELPRECPVADAGQGDGQGEDEREGDGIDD